MNDWNKGTDSARNGQGFNVFGSALEQAGHAAEQARQAQERQQQEQRQREVAEQARKASGSSW